MRCFIILAALIGSAFCLTCYTCDSYIDCNNPKIEYCPISTICYTIRKANQVTYKGCAASCAYLPANTLDTQCTTCSFDNCNTANSADPPQTNNTGSEFGIGRGARPTNSATATSLALVPATLFVARLFR